MAAPPRSTAAAAELLDLALAHTCAELGMVRDHHLAVRTPCARWSLADLLAHMEDSLDAFTEAAGGAVVVHAGAGRDGPAELRVATLRRKAGGLAAVWQGPGPGEVRVGGLDLPGRDLPSRLLLAAAALEIAVHGWDVGQATGSPHPLDDDLAAALLPVARVTVTPEDRGVRFAAARPTPADAPPARLLLAFLGRA